jgi:hypothetical protein
LTAELRFLDAELDRLSWLVYDLWTWQPPRALLPDGPESLIGWYQHRQFSATQRRDWVRVQLSHATAAAAAPAVAWQPPAAAPAPAWQPAPAPALPPAPPPAPPPPPFDWRAFFADNSLAILSYSGAFLLLVAALLFELYSGVGKSGQLAVIAALHGGFLAVGLRFQRRPALAVVGRTYIAAGSLLAPLTWLAAFDLLGLGSRGLGASTALTLAGGYCALLYGALCLRLRAGAYAALSFAAAATAVGGGCAQVGQPSWWGATTAWLVVLVLLMLRERPRWVAFARRRLQETTGAASLVALGASLAYAVIDLTGASVATPSALYLPVTLLALAVAVLIIAPSPTERWLTTSWALLTGAAATATLSFQAGTAGVAVSLTAGAAGTLVVRRLAAPRAATQTRLDALVEDVLVVDALPALLLACSLGAAVLDGHPEPVRSLVLGVLVATAALTAVATRQLAWHFLGATAIAAVAAANQSSLQAYPSPTDALFLPVAAAILTGGLVASLMVLRRPQLAVLAFAAAMATALLTGYALSVDGGVYAGILIAAALVCRLGARQLGRAGSLVDGLGAVALVAAALIPTAAPDAVGIALVAGTVALATWVAVERLECLWLLAGIAVVAARVALVWQLFPAQVDGSAEAPRLTVLPVGLILLAAGGLVCLRRCPRPWLFEAVAVTASATALAGAYALGVSIDAATVVLAACGVGWALVAAALRRPDWQRSLLIGSSVQTIAASLAPTTLGTRIVVVSVAVIVAAVRATQLRRPLLLALGLPGIAAQLMLALTTADPGASPELRLLPIPIAVLGVATAACAVALRRRDLIAALLVELSAVTLLTCNAVTAPRLAYTVALTALGAVAAIVAGQSGSRRTEVCLLGLLHLLITPFVIGDPPVAMALTLTAACVLAVVLALTEGEVVLGTVAVVSGSARGGGGRWSSPEATSSGSTIWPASTPHCLGCFCRRWWSSTAARPRELARPSSR